MCSEEKQIVQKETSKLIRRLPYLFIIGVHNNAEYSWYIIGPK